MSTRVAPVTSVAVVQQPWSERVRALLKPVNLHIAGVSVLGLVNLYLLIHLGVLWGQTNNQNEEAVSQQRAQLRAAQIAAKPLQGLDGKLAASTQDADRFYVQRLPYTYSRVVEELGSLANKENVKLSRVQYGFATVLADPSLTEAKVDASLSGDYKPLVEFVNAIERDKTFFLITSVTLTGQQTGTVNLRLRLVFYKRAAQGGEKSDEPPLSAPVGETSAGEQAQPVGGAVR